MNDCIQHWKVGMHEYSTRRVWTVSNYFFELESNTRYFELFNIIRTTRTQSNCSNQMNYSDMIELFEPNELLEHDRTVRTKWTTRTWSNYSISSNCSNQVGLFNDVELFELCRTFRYLRTVRISSNFSISSNCSN